VPPHSLFFVPEANEAASKPSRRLVRAQLSPRTAGGIFIPQRRRWSSGILTRCSILSASDGVVGGGSSMLLPFLFISNGGRRETYTPPPFIFCILPRMRGGFPLCSIDKRRRCETHTPPPFPSVSNGGA